MTGFHFASRPKVILPPRMPARSCMPRMPSEAGLAMSPGRMPMPSSSTSSRRIAVLWLRRTERFGAGVAGDIGENFLKYPEKGGGLLTAQRNFRDGPMALHTGALWKSLGLDLDGGLQTQAIQNGGTQFGRDFLDRGDGFIGEQRAEALPGKERASRHRRRWRRRSIRRRSRLSAVNNWPR